MRFSDTKINGAYVIDVDKLSDKRGFFTTIWDSKQFQLHNLENKLAECNVSFNKKKGTLRGLHYQIRPYEQVKLIRCTRGKIFDVVVDLRPKSESYMNWYAVELNSQNYMMNYIPKGCAHGFQTLEDNTEVTYMMSQIYMPKFTRGIRWDDTTFKIKWPLKSTVISEKDLSWENFKNQ